MEKQEIAEMCSSFIRLHGKYMGAPRLIKYKDKNIIQVTKPSEWRAGPYCVWVHPNIVEQQRNLEKKIIQRLRKGTAFQCWLKDIPDFLSSLGIVENKKWVSRLPQGDLDRKEVSAEEDIQWRFTRILAGALLVYLDPIRFEKCLVKINLIEPLTVSSKTTSYARGLLDELNKSDLLVNSIFERTLKKLAAGTIPNHNQENTSTGIFSFNARRRIMIREISLLSHQLLRLRTSKKGRFPPELVSAILNIAGISSDVRTIQYIQKDYDLTKLYEAVRSFSAEAMPLTPTSSYLENTRRTRVINELRIAARERLIERINTTGDIY